MQPLPRRALRKQQGLIRRPVGTRMDAAAELLRLEYERAKLLRQRDDLNARLALIAEQLETVEARAVWLHQSLGLAGDPRALSPASADGKTIAVTVNLPVAAVSRASAAPGAASRRAKP